MKKGLVFILVLAMCLSINVKADEGMWLPMLIKRLNYVDMQKKGLQLTAEEIYSVNNSSLKDAIVGLASKSDPLNPFCSAEVISKEGLLLTNHHCAFDAIQQNSTIAHDYLSKGFWSTKKSDELQVEDMAAIFLVRMENVTDKVLNGITDDLSAAQRISKIESASNAIISEATNHNAYKANVKSFFQGNEYYLFVYEVYNDVRLVAAPPSSIGKFGGDTDNWMWPRHTCDFSMLRIYTAADKSSADYSKNNIPFAPKHVLPISIAGVKKDDMTMIMGYPGSTERFLPSYGVQLDIDQINPAIVMIRDTKLAIISRAMKNDPQVKIQYASKYASTANYWKYYIGATKQLKKQQVVEQRREVEDAFTKWVNLSEDRRKTYGNVIWDISEAYKTMSKYKRLTTYIDEAAFQGAESIFFSFGLSPMRSDLYNILTTTPENKSKIEEIAKGFGVQGDKFFKNYNQKLDKQLFIELMQMIYTDIPKDQLPDIFTHIEKKYKGSFKDFAETVYSKSIFTDKERLDKFLLKPSKKLLDKDPMWKVMISFVSKYVEVIVELNNAQSRLDKAQRLFVSGLMKMQPDKKFYDDANSTMRLSYGSVKDYTPSDAVRYEYFTTLDGFMQKEDTANSEFYIPAKLKELYAKKDFGRYAENGVLKTCFLTDNDITGGNSGSPVINAKGQLIGAAFDGNWEAMSGDIKFNPDLNRTISVDIRFVLFIIDKYAGAKNIIDELNIVE